MDLISLGGKDEFTHELIFRICSHGLQRTLQTCNQESSQTVLCKTASFNLSEVLYFWQLYSCFERIVLL